jgi:hypothetical protein
MSKYQEILAAISAGVAAVATWVVLVAYIATKYDYPTVL